MVIMDNYYSQEKHRELSRKIDQLHLSYLEMDESAEKLNQRTKLEDCIAEFLFSANHKNKFIFAETEDVLYRSAAFKRDFSGYKAANAWNALQLYAANLLTQPWRKDYRQIKTYCGFYKHEIEANLSEPEIIFQVMGYKNMANGTLLLDGPICPDKVVIISRDCLVAYVECQILKHIWEELSTQFHVSWLDMLEYRVKYPGNIDQTIQNYKIKYSTNPRFASASQASIQHHHSSSLHTIISPSVYIPHYGCTAYPSVHMNLPKQPIVSHNDSSYSNNGIILPSTIYSVPTAQLIELDHRNGYDSVDNSTTRNNHLKNSIDRLENDATINSQAQENNENEDWDYVFKNLKRQGYSKDLGSRGDVLARSSDKQKKYVAIREPKNVKASNLDEAMLTTLQLKNKPLKMTEALLEEVDEKIEINQPKNNNEQRPHSQRSSYENAIATISSNPVPVSAQLESNLNKWECKSCTYINYLKKDICEMCSKSRDLQEQLMEVGGPECSKCTLVNPRAEKICQACGSSLKNSPTYI